MIVPFSKRVIVHIGPHKTGSTAIQTFFYEHAAQLLEQKVLYPKAGRHPEFPNQHWLFGHAIANADANYMQIFAADLCMEIDEHEPDVIIISTEALARKSVGACKYAEILRMFPNAQVEWAVLLRNPLSLTKSLYAEHLRRGLLSYPRKIRDIACEEHIGQFGRLRALGQASDAVPIRLTSFEAVRANLVEHFCQMLDIPNCMEVQWRDTSRHESLPVRVGELLRYINALPHRIAQPLRRRIIASAWRCNQYLPALRIDSAGLHDALAPFYADCLAIEELFFDGVESGYSLARTEQDGAMKSDASQKVAGHEWLKRQVIAYRP